MMYIRERAAIARLTLVVAGNLPVAAGLLEKMLPDAACQRDNATAPVGQERCGRMLTERAPAHTWPRRHKSR
jgi:hypothetical protein